MHHHLTNCYLRLGSATSSSEVRIEMTFLLYNVMEWPHRIQAQTEPFVHVASLSKLLTNVAVSAMRHTPRGTGSRQLFVRGASRPRCRSRLLKCRPDMHRCDRSWVVIDLDSGLPFSNPNDSSCNFRSRFQISALSAEKAHAVGTKHIAARGSCDA